jgi:hypothetical protein
MTLSILSPAALLASAIQWQERADGSRFLALADGSPQWMRDAIRSAHDEELPNDWRYELALRAALALRDEPAADCYELASQVAEQLSTVYTGELLHWYAESPARLSYADEAREELGSGSADDVGGMLQLGQWLAAQRGALALFDTLSEAYI